MHGLWALSFGQAAATAHVSKGGLQRYFASKEAMQVAVLEHVATTLDATVFKSGHSPEMVIEAWYRWLDGRGLLSGGCVLAATAGVVGASAELDEGEIANPLTVATQSALAHLLDQLARHCTAGDRDAAWALYGAGLAHRQRIRLRP